MARRRPRTAPHEQGPELRRQRVLATLDAVPPGRVTTYGELAREAGLPGRARLVGRLLRELPAGTELPWHRVLGAGGHVRTQGAAARRQVARLRREGVRVEGLRVDLARHAWDGS